MDKYQHTKDAALFAQDMRDLVQCRQALLEQDPKPETSPAPSPRASPPPEPQRFSDKVSSIQLQQYLPQGTPQPDLLVQPPDLTRHYTVPQVAVGSSQPIAAPSPAHSDEPVPSTLSAVAPSFMPSSSPVSQPPDLAIATGFGPDDGSGPPLTRTHTASSYDRIANPGAYFAHITFLFAEPLVM